MINKKSIRKNITMGLAVATLFSGMPVNVLANRVFEQLECRNIGDMDEYLEDKVDIDEYLENKLDKIMELYSSEKIEDPAKIFLLNRAGVDLNENIVNKLNSSIKFKSGKKKTVNPEKLANIILAYRSMELNPEDVEEFNLIEDLLKSKGYGSLNDYTYSLIALNSDNYKTVRENEKLLNELIQKTIKLVKNSKKTSEIGLGLLALSPYYNGEGFGKYNNNSEITTLVDEKIQFLKDNQKDNGLFKDSENSDSLGYVIMGISSINLDYISDGSFMKNEESLLEILYRFDREIGFKEKTSDDENDAYANLKGDAATKIVVTAIMNNFYMSDNEKSVYNFKSDIEEKTELLNKVDLELKLKEIGKLDLSIYDEKFKLELANLVEIAKETLNKDKIIQKDIDDILLKLNIVFDNMKNEKLKKDKFENLNEKIDEVKSLSLENYEIETVEILNNYILEIEKQIKLNLVQFEDIDDILFKIEQYQQNLKLKTLPEISKELWIVQKNITLSQNIMMKKDKSFWDTITLIKSDVEVKEKDLKAARRVLFNRKDEFKKGINPKKMAEAIITYRAAGQNPENIEGKNLIEELIFSIDGFRYEGRYNLDALNYLLYAINTDKYETTVKYQDKVDEVIENILKMQKKDGSFREYKFSIDTTETLIALAPYYKGVSTGKYNGDEKIKKSVDRAIEALSKMQLKTGGFEEKDSEGKKVETSDPLSLIFSGVLAIDAELLEDEMFIKDGNTMIDALQTYENSNGFNFKQIPSNDILELRYNDLVTEQVFRGTVIYMEAKNNRDLFDLSYIKIKGKDEENEALSKLKLIIKECREIKGDLYTNLSYGKLIGAVEDGEEIVKSKASIEEIIDAIDNIERMKLQLELAIIEEPKEEDKEIEEPKEEDKEIEEPKEEDKEVEEPKEEDKEVEEQKEEDKEVEEPKEEDKEIEKPKEEDKEIEEPKEEDKEVEEPKEEDKEVEKPKEEDKEVEKPKEEDKEVEKPKEEDKEVEKPKEEDKEIEKPKEEDKEIEKPKEEKKISSGKSKRSKRKNKEKSYKKEDKKEEKNDSKKDKEIKEPQEDKVTELDLTKKVEKLKEKVDFKDINENHWAKKEIDELCKRGIINGRKSSLFAPKDNITRAEFISIINRALGYSDEVDKEVDFKDVNKDNWFYNDVNIAYQKGLIKGKTKDKFKPNQNITREEVAKILGKLIEVNNKNEEYNFKDINLVSDWAREDIMKLVNLGIIEGNKNKINPKKLASRAESSVMVYRLLEVLNK